MSSNTALALSLIALLAIVVALWLPTTTRGMPDQPAPAPVWWPERRPGPAREDIRRDAHCRALIDCSQGTRYPNPHQPGSQEFVQWAIDYVEACELIRASAPPSNPNERPA